MSRLPIKAVRRLGFRQTVRGAIILGLLVGLIMGAQGAAYAEAFPTETSRQKLVVTLGSLSGANFFAGEIANVARPDSYAIYKSIATSTLIVAVWGLMVSTRLLRGFEEDGKLEVLQAGALTKSSVSKQLLLGFAGSLTLSALIAFGLIAGLGSTPEVGMSTVAAFYVTLATFLPGLVFAALGVFASQLARTRSRAIVYALVPMIALYIIRGTANSVENLNWLKHLSPFGWSDLLNPALGPRPIWIIPSLLVVAIFTALGLYWAGKRDLGEALIRQSDTERSHFYLLGSSNTLALRQHLGMFAWWALGIVAFSAFFAAVANASTNLVNDSPALQQVLPASTATEIKLLFLGVGTMFSATFLLVMSTIALSRIRRDEAKGYLDNMLVQPVRRTKWLAWRLGLIMALVMAIALLSALATWVVARVVNIEVGFGSLTAGALSLVGVLMLTLGIGAAVYGIVPRLAVAAMSIVIGWAFVLDILKSFFHLNSFIAKTSVLSYVPSNPTHTPDWSAVAWLVVVGLVLAVVGSMRFSKRDVVAE